MAGADETLVAATTVLQTLARDEPTTDYASLPFDFEFPATNGAKSSKLPGKPSPAKIAFEAELEALMRRVHHLEFQAQQSPNQPDGRQRTLSGPEEKFLHPPQPSAPVRDIDEDDTDEEDETGATRVVREEDISLLRNHVQKQAEEISLQKDNIAQVRDELQKQEEHTRCALTKVEKEDAVLLERELWKHQQVNEAFQKALREIGGIITQVTNGDK